MSLKPYKKRKKNANVILEGKYSKQRQYKQLEI